MKIMRPFGIEMTRVHPKVRLDWDQGWTREGDSRRLDRLCREWNERFAPRTDLIIGGRAETDPGCLEFSSVVLASLDEAELLWDLVDGSCKKLGMAPCSDNQWGGGGQITVNYIKTKNLTHKASISTKRKDFYRFSKKVIRAVAENPFITWALSDPSDNGSQKLFGIHDPVEFRDYSFEDNDDPTKNFTYASSRVRTNSTLNLSSEVFSSRFLDFDIQQSSSGILLRAETGVCCNKETAVNFRSLNNLYGNRWNDLLGRGRIIKDHKGLDHSVEYRFFGTAMNLKMQIAHVKFAQALTEYIDKEWVSSVDNVLENFQKFRQDKKACIKKFYEFVEILGLEPRNYRWCKEYLDQRFDLYGIDYLV